MTTDNVLIHVENLQRSFGQLKVLAGIDIDLKDILIIWVERVILSLVIAGVVVRFLFPIMGVAM